MAGSQPKPGKRKRKKEYRRRGNTGDRIVVVLPARGTVRITGPDGLLISHEPMPKPKD